MRIGELSERTGVSVRALRYYEEQGMLRPARDPNGYREYDEVAVGRVAQIRMLFAAGLSSARITRVLPRICGPTDDLVADPRLAGELEQDRERVLARIEDLTGALRTLERVIAASRTGPWDPTSPNGRPPSATGANLRAALSGTKPPDDRFASDIADALALITPERRDPQAGS